jgi:hypothetical protein
LNQEQLLNEILNTRYALRDLYTEYYTEFEVFGWRWWLSVALLIVPLAIWWFKTDKKRLLEISFFGLLVNVSCAVLDALGTAHVLWIYPVHVLPHVCLLAPVDFAVIPVVGMSLYQRYASWRAFVIGALAASFIMAFILEPFASLIGIYKLIVWRYVYSFPIYFGIFAGAKALTGRFMHAQKRRRESEWYSKTVSFKRPPAGSRRGGADRGGGNAPV